MSETPAAAVPTPTGQEPTQSELSSVPQSSIPQNAVPLGYRMPVRPPLTPSAKKGAFWAGAVGFNLLTLGFTLVIIPIVAALFGAFVAFIFNQIARTSDDLSTGFLAMRGFFLSMDFGLLAIIGVAVAIVGLAIMAGALLASRAILRAHGVNRPGAVTWAGAGIAIVASWFVGWIPALIAQIISAVISESNVDGLASISLIGGIGWLFSVAVTTLVGWLAWWWMAHVFRTDPGPNQIRPVKETQG